MQSVPPLLLLGNHYMITFSKPALIVCAAMDLTRTARHDDALFWIQKTLSRHWECVYLFRSFGLAPGGLLFHKFARMNSQCIGNLDYIGGFCAMKRAFSGHVLVDRSLIYAGFIGQTLNRPAFRL